MTVEERQDVIFLEVTWTPTLKICWSILWRFSVFGFFASAGIGIVLKLLLGYAGVSLDASKYLSDFAGMVAGLAVFVPVMKVVLKKAFSDFRIALIQSK
jgi:hypothetical protein